jgi:hypothetical protein
MKARCPNCNRITGVAKNKQGARIFPKHRTGRSTKKNVKPVCVGTGTIVAKPMIVT